MGLWSFSGLAQALGLTGAAAPAAAASETLSGGSNFALRENPQKPPALENPSSFHSFFLSPFDWLARKFDRHLLPQMLPAVTSLAIANHGILDVLADHVREPVWESALDRLAAEGVPVPRDKVRTYEDYKAYLADHDIDFPERVRSLRTVFTVLETRDRLYGAGAKDIGRDRPILVMVGAKVDENGALEARCFPTLDKIARSGRFDVLYFETDSDTGVERILTDVHDLTGRQIHTLVLDAHGSRESITMGEGAVNDDNNTIDTGDIEQDGAFGRLNEYLAPEGQIVLLGCSNGAPMPWTWERFRQHVEWAAGFRDTPADPSAGIPESEYFNIAQAFSHQAPGRPVYASEVPTNLRAFSFDPDTLRPVISWIGNREFVAVAGLEQYFALKERLKLLSDQRFADQALQSAYQTYPGDCDSRNMTCSG